MSRCSLRRLPWVCALIFYFVGGLFPIAVARGDDPQGELLEQTRLRDKVAAQKAEAELRQLLDDVQRLAKSNRAEALLRLKNALAELESNTALPPERRESWTRILKNQVRVAEREEQATKTRPAEKRPQRNDPKESENINKGLSRIRDLQNEGKTDQASRAASELAAQHPEDPRLQAANRAAAMMDQVNNARKTQLQHERSVVGSLRDVDQSSTPAAQEVEFPKDWKDRTKGRSATVELSPKEKAIMRALNQVVSPNFKNAKLDDVIEYLQTTTGQTIIVDREGLKDVDASYDSPVTLSLRGITVRTALRKILADLGMTYVVKDEAIMVTSVQRAQEMMVVRRYYIGDLLSGMGALAQIGGLPRNYTLPAYLELQAKEKAASAQTLIEMITSAVDPHSWQGNGGSGTISYHSPSASLIIKQSAEVHAMIGGSLPK